MAQKFELEPFNITLIKEKKNQILSEHGEFSRASQTKFFETVMQIETNFNRLLCNKLDSEEGLFHILFGNIGRK